MSETETNAVYQCDSAQVKENQTTQWRPSKQGRHAHSLWLTHDYRPVKENNRYYAYCKICKRVLKTTAVERLQKHRKKCNNNSIATRSTNAVVTPKVEEFHEADEAKSVEFMNNGDETTSENADVKLEQIFLHSETESEVQSRDALSIFFQSIESQTRNLPVHLRLLAKRKISEVIFDLEEKHIGEMNL